MNKFIVCFLCLLMARQAQSQTDTLALSEDGYLLNGADTVLEALVKMALENPRIKSAQHSATQAEYFWRRDRTLIYNQISVSGNLNEYSIKGKNSSADPLRQSTVYPRYNIGVNIPIGLIANSKKLTAANFNLYQSRLEDVRVEQQTVRREVTILYEQYQMNEALMRLQLEVLDDARLVNDRNEQRFEAGEITLEAYSASVRAYNAEKVKQVNITFALSQTEAYLEELIGMKYKDALQQINIRMSSTR